MNCIIIHSPNALPTKGTTYFLLTGLPDEPHSAGEYFAPVPYLLARYSKEIKLLAAILTNLLLLQFSNNRSIVINKKGR